MKLPGHSDPCRCATCSGHEGRPFLSLVDVNFERERRRILSDVNFTVDLGDFIAITGPNGGGKTTLLRIILGLLKPTSGKVVFYDADGIETIPQVPGYLPQKNSVDAHFPITVREVIASGLLASKDMLKSEREEKIERALELTRLCDVAKRPIGRLSGGQVQRTLFGRAIVSEPSFLVMDEPLSYIDSYFENQMYSIMQGMAQKTTILMVSHQMTHIGAIANRHIIVDGTLRECTHKCHYVQTDCD